MPCPPETQAGDMARVSDAMLSAGLESYSDASVSVAGATTVTVIVLE